MQLNKNATRIKTTNNVAKLWHYIRPYRLAVFATLAMLIVNAIATVVEPYILGLAITEITKNLLDISRGIEGAGFNYSYLFRILVIYFVRGLIVQVTNYGSNYCMTNAVQNGVRDLRIDVINKINRLPVSYFDRNQFGDMLGRLTSDIESLSNALQQSFLQLVMAVLSIVFAIGMMLLLDWQLAVILLISMPLSFIVARLIVRMSQKHFNQQAHALGQMNGYIQEAFTGFNVTKLFVREEQSMASFYEITNELSQVGFKANFSAAVLQPLVGVVSHFAYLAIAVFGGLKTIAGTLTIGNLQAFTQYVWQVNQPIQMITQLTGPMQAAAAAMNRIFQVLEHPEEPDTATIPLKKALTGQVEFENVSFAYTPEKPLIRNFNASIEPGEMIAIVGPTGAGKTTMINLLMRFYEVSEGSIKVDGIDIENLPRGDYRQQFGMVLQDAWLFEGTIKENLRFGKLDATDEEIIEAAKAANVDHFIRTLPGGYDMKINQESSNISLGQKQLLTIARALLADPKILILDEATSSVDTRLEKLIQSAMGTLMEGRTSFVIAHRLSTIQDADNILVMDDGQIIEQGNHDELLAAGGFYHDLYHSQFAHQ